MRCWMRKSISLSFFLTSLVTAFPRTDQQPTSKETLNILERRQSSCPASNPVSCAAVDSKLPSDFCCSAGSSCISLDSSSTALCCPNGGTCPVIQTIDCDISLQDPSKHTSGPVFTTRLTDSLAKCPGNNKCCPFGYTCGTSTDGSAICQIVADKAITKQPSSSTTSSASSTSATTSSTSSSSSLSPEPTSSQTSTNVSPASTSSIDSTKPQASQSANPFPASVFLAGFFPGMLIGAFGVLAWVIFTGRHKKAEDNHSTTSSVYKKKPYISDPVPVDPQNARTDFLRKTNTMAKSLFTKRNQAEGTPGLPFDSWKMPTPPEPNNIPDRPTGRQISAGPGALSYSHQASRPPMAQYPVTPERQIYPEQPGMERETIHVYSPEEIEVPSATVPPLRGMKSRGKAMNSSVGSPFVTPARRQEARAPIVVAQTPPPRQEPTYETLTPARYEGNPDQKRLRPANPNDQGRPETSFTTMLESINFPDPMNQKPPEMPAIPKQYRR